MFSLPLANELLLFLSVVPLIAGLVLGIRQLIPAEEITD